MGFPPSSHRMARLDRTAVNTVIAAMPMAVTLSQATAAAWQDGQVTTGLPLTAQALGSQALGFPIFLKRGWEELFQNLGVRIKSLGQSGHLGP